MWDRREGKQTASTHLKLGGDGHLLLEQSVGLASGQEGAPIIRRRRLLLFGILLITSRRRRRRRRRSGGGGDDQRQSAGDFFSPRPRPRRCRSRPAARPRPRGRDHLYAQRLHFLWFPFLIFHCKLSSSFRYFRCGRFSLILDFSMGILGRALYHK